MKDLDMDTDTNRREHTRLHDKLLSLCSTQDVDFSDNSINKKKRLLVFLHMHEFLSLVHFPA